MAIPPFPPQDLAKLVLGYLAEEELMTAYDEFLQASPYLDAFRNEYDRIFMTSLRSILADYRAVKIHVETCRPNVLRKKLLQCSNLLEIVKFLINIIDPHKLSGQDNADKSRLQKTNVSKGTICEACSSLNLKNCVCKSNLSTSIYIQSNRDQPIGTNNPLEATSLEDLPGNSSFKNKSKLEAPSKSLSVADQKDNGQAGQIQDMLSSTTNSANKYDSASSLPNNTVMVNHISQITKPTCMDSKQKIEEFNNILNLVCNKSVTNDKLCDNLVSNAMKSRVSGDGSFQDFAAGVNGNNHEKVKHVPDSSTSEMYLPYAPSSSKETIINNIKGPPNHPLNHPVINLSSPSNLSEKQINRDGLQIGHKEANKLVDNKIRILSDIKFDNKSNSPIPLMPAILKNNMTASPCLPKHTFIINGTPANRKRPVTMSSNNYSKDEIMAMPTLIIVPTSGPYNIVSTTANSTTSMQNNKNAPCSEAPNISPKRGPLYIEVPSENVGLIQHSQKDVSETKASDIGLVKTVEKLSHASLPKDNTLLSKTSTPQVFPPLRKSSSTPRRSSHVRVLDFTTPRRILDEAIPEKENTSEDTVVVVSDSPERPVSNENNFPEKAIIGQNLSTEIKKDKKKRNWDEELRALVPTNEYPISSSKPKSSRKSKNSKSKLIEGSTEDIHKKEQTKEKRTKKKNNSRDYVEEPKPSDLNTDKPIKPTINIISAQEHIGPSEAESDKKQNKSNEIEDPIDTPETDRLSLQNVIGAKLNISDLLETPYKQAIYDIQMETPRFLGPDIPGEPISDIKIMNIPTPRFFDTPKPSQATPSSYSSRPTDYSSGGSYYKPDDQDYVPSIDVASCTLTETKLKEEKDKTKNLKSKDNSSKETRRDSTSDIKLSKSKRPVRKCTKNVSYYNSPNINNLTKTKDLSDDDSSEVNNANLSREKSIKSLKSNSSKTKVIKSRTKLEKHKSPFKKEVPKNFMKIKPRRLTPVKGSSSRNRKTSSELILSARRKTMKEKPVNTSMQSLTVVPTKSRRKSSTPRKLHCNKSFHSSTSSNNTSPEVPVEKKTERKDINICITHDSDSEQQALRWSDDGSQDVKVKRNNESSVKEGEDIIVKIQEYIENIETKQTTTTNTTSTSVGSLQNDLIDRGFDEETAKRIERDLLVTPPLQDGAVQSTSNDINEDVRDKVSNEGEKIESNSADTGKKVELNQNPDDDKVAEDADDIDFSTVETNEDTNNYFVYAFDEVKHKPNEEIVKLKDKFCMEVCIDDGVSVMLRASQFSVMLDQEPVTEKEYNKKEIEAAVTSISTIEKLYTPIKDPRMQCYELFDSTLTSLDTPLKENSPKGREYESSITEIVLEVENISSKAEGKKRRRVQSGASDEGPNTNKRNKPDPQYLLNQANIQNIDIESVLSKLHGP